MLASLTIVCAAFGLSACSPGTDTAARQTAGGQADQTTDSAGAPTVSSKTYDLDSDTSVLATINNCAADTSKALAKDSDLNALVSASQKCFNPYVGSTFTWTQKIGVTHGIQVGTGYSSELVFGFPIPGDTYQMNAVCPVEMTTCSQLSAGAMVSVVAKLTPTPPNNYAVFMIQSIAAQ